MSPILADYNDQTKDGCVVCVYQSSSLIMIDTNQIWEDKVTTTSRIMIAPITVSSHAIRSRNPLVSLSEAHNDHEISESELLPMGTNLRESLAIYLSWLDSYLTCTFERLLFENQVPKHNYKLWMLNRQYEVISTMRANVRSLTCHFTLEFNFQIHQRVCMSIERVMRLRQHLDFAYSIKGCRKCFFDGLE